jgi:hypothetical protein
MDGWDVKFFASEEAFQKEMDDYARGTHREAAVNDS